MMEMKLILLFQELSEIKVIDEKTGINFKYK